ncbi:hypothetical protein [Akkermansia sp.]|uniref:hypothetical protein n=1 Tax=Akkermansia sp. TaxID=1872421 RepID=UPI002047AD18|nr:hypothetical protein [Akkermansia sp.]MCC8040752.1 hypothetical protein [Akkermansia sp.]MCC8066296.1 hypothetical protein [Clostridiales bacterium]DAL73827.1 MAG TPA: zinc-ribbon domain protein [Caudoviricetes sp.]
MKDIKCPLCGRSLQFFPDLHEIAMGRIGCPNCDWTTLLGFEETVWEEAEKIVSKFPPIMRVNVGDKLTYFGTRDFVTVVRKDTKSCEIQIETPEGELYIIEPKDVHKWPWELERKGGEEQ